MRTPVLHTGNQTSRFLPQGPYLGFRTRSKSRPSKGQRDTWPEVLFCLRTVSQPMATGSESVPTAQEAALWHCPRQSFTFPMYSSEFVNVHSR